jgi:hypothetical protein
MKLVEAYSLLDSLKRVFSDVAKHYNWKDDSELKDYLDFIVHEPVQWMKGFPATYALGSPGFAKPKTTLVKLLKNDVVKAELGEEYTKKVRDAVWSTYKELSKNIVEEEPKVEEPVLEIVDDMEAIEVNSIHSMRGAKGKDRSEVLATALRAFIEAEKDKHPGLAAVSLTLLDAFLNA